MDALFILKPIFLKFVLSKSKDSINIVSNMLADDGDGAGAGGDDGDGGAAADDGDDGDDTDDGGDDGGDDGDGGFKSQISIV